MIWNYRIIKTKAGYQVHEVYYKKGKPTYWTTEGVSPSGDKLCDLNDDWEHYKIAFEKPVLIEKKLYEDL